MRVVPVFALMAAALALVSGCSRKDEPKPAAAPSAAAGPVGMATQKSGGGAIDCDVLVPAALRQRLMPGTKMSAGSFANRTLMCSAEKEGGLAFHVTFDCRPTTTHAQWKAKMEEAGKTSAALAGIGREAYGTQAEIDFYDDDADCAVTSSAYQGGDAQAVAKEVAATLTSSLLPPVEKGKYALDCDRLLPADLRQQFLAGARRVEADSTMTDVMDCRVKFPDFAVASVNYNCAREFSKTIVAEMKPEFEKNKMACEEVAVGAAGLLVSTMGMPSVTFVDSHLPCLVTVTGTKVSKERALALARAVDAALTAETAR